MSEKEEVLLCDSCVEGPVNGCLLNPGGDCMKADYVHYKPKPAEGEINHPGEQSI